jgi:hypothetical protein
LGKVTLVVEFEDGKEPSINYDMVVAGGNVVSIAWEDFRVNFFSPSDFKVVFDALEAYENIEPRQRRKVVCKLKSLTTQD